MVQGRQHVHGSLTTFTIRHPDRSVSEPTAMAKPEDKVYVAINIVQ